MPLTASKMGQYFKLPDTTAILAPAPYHVLSYGALLGTQFFHTFINSIAAFKVLDRPQFGVLQRAVFPAYFGIQTAAPIVLALTYPGRVGRVGLLPRSIQGVLHPANRWVVLVPLATAFVTGFVNLVYFLPETNKITAQRRQLEPAKESKESKKSSSKTVKSKEPKDSKDTKEVKMAALNKKFGQLHGASTLFNLATFVATVVYGVHLSFRIV